jgi:hypothetical protein
VKQTMQVLLYTKSKDSTEDNNLRRVLEAVVPKKNIEVCQTVKDLSERLVPAPKSGMILLLLLSSKEDLIDLLPIDSLLFEVRTILVLPDRTDETVALGHALRPRFLSYRDDNFIDVGAVLSKMVGNFVPSITWGRGGRA